MTKCFISHTWREGEHDFAIRLAEALRANGVDVWLDQEQIHGGQLVEQRMHVGVIHECDVFLFVLSPASLNSWGCAIELEEALKCRAETGLQIVPILLKKCEIPENFQSLLYVDFRDEGLFDESVRHLLPSIEAASRIRSLVAQLINGDADSRAEAAQHLGNLRNPFTVPILASRLSADSDPTVRYWLAFALGQIGGEEAITALKEAKKRETHPFVLLGTIDGLREASPTDEFAIEHEDIASLPHVFVAMPFRKDMDDVFYYGIQRPVHAAGFLCERIDQDSFTGDILDRVKKRIETAAIVIAELSGANPNVYLEVGYAWGKGRPTVLLVKDPQELCFDVRGQRCLTYERIMELEESLTKELRGLVCKGLI